MSNNRDAGKSDPSTSPIGVGLKRRDLLLSGSSLVAASALSAVGLTIPAEAQQPTATPAPAGQKPNIVFIMGDDIGWLNIGAYHRGMMAGRTPNLDRLAAEGMLFTDYYAEASCTAGRANFITGQLPIRTGLTTVGQAGATSACRLKRRPSPPRSRRWATPPASSARTTWATATSSCRRSTASTSSSATSITSTRWRTRPIPTTRRTEGQGRPAQHAPLLGDRRGRPDRHPRWGKVGKQKIEDAGTLYPEADGDGDDEILDHTFKFIDKAKGDDKPFFFWLNPTRMHVVTHLSEKYEKMRNAENGWSV